MSEAMCLGLTGVITGIRDDDGVSMALIDSDDPGAVKSACLITCPEAGVGDTVLVHSGYVLRIVDVQEVSV